ncbi:Uncharacterised protein [uncultured archaeon]|nr:Uncharacterised protein [uncultured archaeon]
MERSFLLLHVSSPTPHFLKTVDFMLYWIIQSIEPNIIVKIYDEKNRNKIYNNGNQEGIWMTKLFFCKGLYTMSTENGHSLLNIQGTAKTVIIFTESLYLFFYFFFCYLIFLNK